jgi:hypothetical protein
MIRHVASTGAVVKKTHPFRFEEKGMPFIIVVQTDENGSFKKSDTFRIPGTSPLTVQLTVRLQSPPALTVNGTLDIDATDGDPQNEGKSFALHSGEQLSLGSWNLGEGFNKMSVSGQTAPPLARGTLRFDVDPKVAPLLG